MIAGLDVGTSGSKIVVYDTSGNIVDKFYKSYKQIINNGSYEIDGNDLISAIKSILKEACCRFDIDSIGVDTFGEAFIMLDENDKPLTNIIVSTDQHGAEQVDELIEKLGKENIENITGVTPSQIFSLPKIMWIRDNHPEIFSKCKRILLMEDYVIYSLTGNAIIDYSLAARSLAFDVNKLQFSSEILNAVNIDINLFSKPVELCHNCGHIIEALQKELGFNREITISTAGHDQVAVDIGSAVFEKEIATDGSGTVECITPVFDNSINRKAFIENNYAIVPYIFKGTYTTYAYFYTSGTLIEWFISNFGKHLKENAYQELESKFKDEPTGLFVIPHFAGAGTPYMDGGAKGAIIGLTLSDSIEDIYKAVLEGIAYEMKVNCDRMADCGLKIKKLVATGGGSSSRKWLQIKSDILNLPIDILDDNQSGCRGSAICGAIAKGIFNDIVDASKIMVKKVGTILPNEENHKKYEVLYKKYSHLYNLLKEVR